MTAGPMKQKRRDVELDYTRVGNRHIQYIQPRTAGMLTS